MALPARRKKGRDLRDNGQITQKTIMESIGAVAEDVQERPS